MATKRKTIRKKAEPKVFTSKPKEPCKMKGCKEHTAYMKRNRKTGEMEYWCAPHFKSEVEEPNKEWGRKIVEEYKNNEKRKKRILAKQKGEALLPAKKRAIKKSLASPKRRVVKGKKK